MADTILDAFTPAPLNWDSSETSILDASWLSQSFTPTSSYVAASFEILLYREAGLEGNCNIYIYNTESDQPVGSPIASVTYDAALLTTDTSGTLLNLPFDDAVALQSGVTYAAVVTAVAGQGEWVKAKGSNDAQYAGGGVSIGSNSGSSWASFLDFDIQFAVYGTVMPNDKTIAENTSTDEFGEVAIEVGDRMGQSFLAAVTATVGEVTFNFYRILPDGEITAYIYECDEEYVPVGNAIATSAPILTDSLTLPAIDRSLFFNNAVTLFAGQRYAVVMETTAGVIRLIVENTSGYAPGRLVISDDSGSNWTGSASNDTKFRLGGTALGGGGNIPTDVSLFESWGF
jgi:hypothetical protein